MILKGGATLCLAYYLACGVRWSFKTSLLWGWPLASAYFFALSYLPLPWRNAALAPFLLYLVFFALFLRKNPGPDAAQSGDALLVLGSRGDGALPPRFARERAEKAAELYRQKAVPVVVSGGRLGRERSPEAETLRDDLIRCGVAEDAILTESASKTTWENLSCSAPLLAGAQNVTVITHGFHRRRVFALAKRALPGKALSFATLPERAGFVKLHLLIRESFTYFADLLRGRAAL